MLIDLYIPYMPNIMEDITEHDIYVILLNMLLNKEQCKSNRNK